MSTDLDGFRVAIATDTWTPQLNGVARTLRRLVNEARQRGADVRVFTPYDPRRTEADEGVTEFPSRTFWAYPELRMSWPSAAEFTALWKDWRPDLVHATTPCGVGLAARRAARQLHIPFATSYHTSLSQYAEFYRVGYLTRPIWAILRWFHNSGLRTWCPTPAIADELRGRGFERTALWSRGVDAEAFSPKWRSTEFRRAHGVADGELLVAYVGRIAREKGIDNLMSGMRLATSISAVPIRLMMVGDGPYEQESRSGAPEGTIFTGSLYGRDLSTAYASADVFVFPSVTDTFGNVVLEAMASGLPIIGADCAVTRGLLAGGTGLLFNSVASLASSVLHLASESAERRLIARKGRLEAESRTWDSIFDRLFSEYLELAGGRVRVPSSDEFSDFRVPEPRIAAYS